MYFFTEIIRKYEIAYRDLVTFKTKSTNANVDDALLLNEEKDWYFICTALDVIGDTTLAIKDFLEYGFEGPGGMNDDGEKYLRLYGVLKATYLQQEAISTLYNKINLRDSPDVSDKFETLGIREVRNKIGAHSTNIYSKRQKGDKESYIPVRHSMSGHKFYYLNNERIAEEIWVDLAELLMEHLKLILELLDETYEKTIKTVYRGNQLKRNEELNKLTELRKLKNEILSVS